MNDRTPADFAEMLVTLADPALLPHALPHPPLEILIALHRIVTNAMYDDLPRARQAAQAAWMIAERFPTDLLLRAQAHWSCGSAVLFVPAYQTALDHYDAALHCYVEACKQDISTKLSRDVRVVEIVRVFCLTELGRHPEAQRAADNAHAVIAEQPASQQSRLRLKLLINESSLAGNVDEYERMLALTEEARLLAQQEQEAGDLAFAWINRAYAYIALGQIEEAEAALNNGIAAAIKAEDPLTQARALCNRAVLLRSQGQLFEALNVLRTAERSFTDATGETAMLAQEMASIYAQLRQLPEALAAAQRAATGFANQLMPAYSAHAALEGARYAIALHRSDDARTLLHQAADQADSAALPTLQAEVAITQALAAATLRPIKPLTTRQIRATRTAATHAVGLLGAHGLAEATAQGVLAVAALDMAQGNQADAIAAYATLVHHPTPHIQLEALQGLGKLLPSSEGLGLLEQAADLALVQRRQLPNEELLARFSSVTTDVYLDLATCRTRLGDVHGALAAVWTAKAGPLLDLRNAVGAHDSTVVPILTQAKTEIARHRAQAYDLQRRAQDAYNEKRLIAAMQLDSQVKQANQATLVAEQALTDALRTIGGRDGHADVPPISAIQAQLPADMALLEFAALDEQLVVFLLQADRALTIHHLGPLRPVQEHLHRLSLVHSEVGRRRNTLHTDLAAVLAPLGRLLITPLRAALEGINHVLIAPWDVLAHVPWAALLDALDWPIMTVTLTPCGALWGAPPSIPTQPLGPPRLLGYASTDSRQLAHVPQELAAIHSHLSESVVIPVATINDLRAAPAPIVLHIAAHGRTSNDVPMCSTLELADGSIMLLEIHRLDLQGTRLVTLSACETSVRPEHGEMVLALAGAFLSAGAHAVIASLWAVDDAATAALMKYLYEQIAAGVPPASALAYARRAISSRAPLEAAAFQLWSSVAQVEGLLGSTTH